MERNFFKNPKYQIYLNILDIKLEIKYPNTKNILTGTKEAQPNIGSFSPSTKTIQLDPFLCTCWPVTHNCPMSTQFREHWHGSGDSLAPASLAGRLCCVFGLPNLGAPGATAHVGTVVRTLQEEPTRLLCLAVF